MRLIFLKDWGNTGNDFLSSEPVTEFTMEVYVEFQASYHLHRLAHYSPKQPPYLTLLNGSGRISHSLYV
ncbi:hypothetical protein LLO_0455 [Legionella longbeachae NSW150]|uniref:Uncharacterized protein n=1 Tax=Legionella longbeachae serogroup 1 (strain NSW150) TaxID=661367 RepID=D3HPH2_LEGLN|nr:hypothetical protein LLO_0455 [Legionella longbeachae NSW150]